MYKSWVNYSKVGSSPHMQIHALSRTVVHEITDCVITLGARDCHAPDLLLGMPILLQNLCYTLFIFS